MPKAHYREPERLESLAGGINDSRHPTAIAPNETPDCENIEFDRDSVRSCQGALKFGNQIAPRSAVRTSVDRGFSPLTIGVSNEGDGTLQSVPLRNYCYFPYSERADIGGGFQNEGTFPNLRYHTARGKSFELKVSFQVPEDVDLLPGFLLGDDADSSSGTDSIKANYGANEALDDTIIILQKGGDRTAPMSWALALVNTGAAPSNSSDTDSRSPFYWLADLYGVADPQREEPRPSPYALCFMWLDSPSWGEPDSEDFAYRVDSGVVYDGATLDGSAIIATQSLRAIVCEKFIEPGRTYHVALQVDLDSGSIGTVAGGVFTAWNQDGFVKFQVAEDYGNVQTYSWMPGQQIGAGGIWVYKGPADSIDYLVKYGIRYSGKDAMFGGLGYRQAPFNDQGFIPYGMDSAPMEHGGHRMVDRSVITADGLYDTGNYDLTFTYSGTDEIECDQENMVVGNGAGQQSPISSTGDVWEGFGGTSGIIRNTDALNGYRLVFSADAAATLRGGVMTVAGTTHNTSKVQFQLHNPTAATAAAGTFTSEGNCFLQAFRWNQRDLIIGDVRVYAAPRDYTDDRVAFSLRSTVELDDETEPGLVSLLAYWPMDDAGGGALREEVAGIDGYLAPFGLGVSARGTRGKKRLFLSGEGEALELDLSKNPVLKRELYQMLRTGKTGFAIELTLVMPEAYYGVSRGIVSSNRFGELCPCLASWDVNEADESGHVTNPKPIIQLTHRAQWSFTHGTEPASQPMMFQVLYRKGTDTGEIDEQLADMTEGNQVYTLADGFYYDVDAPWVGNTVTLQFGVHPTGTEDEFHVYLAVKPVNFINPGSGTNPSQGEIQYFNTTSKTTGLGDAPATVTISKKDLLRSVITIGGCADPTGLGYSEVRARMIADEARVFGSVAPGAIGTANGEPLADDNGKLSAGRGLPLRELLADDILRPIAPSSRVANVVDGSQIVTAASNQAFSTVDSAEDIDGVQGTYLLVNGDEFVKNEGRDAPTRQEEFYGIDAVAADGSTLTTVTPVRTASATAVTAYSFRLIGYTSFADDISRKPIALGGGVPFKPGTTKASDVVRVPDLYFNRAPVTGNFGLAIFSPVAGGSVAGVQKMWVRGLSAPRRNPILGIKNINEKVFAAARGALFLADDRWREDGPSRVLSRSLEFFPGQRDYAAWRISRNADFFYGPNNNNKLWQFDAWVWLDSAEGVQTIAWHGSVEHGLELIGGSSDDDENSRKLRWFWRINNGRQEFGIGSPQNYSGGSEPPEFGQYIATDTSSVPTGQWVHLRIEIEFDSGDANFPYFYINGKRKPGDAWDNVVVNASTNSDLSDNPWIDDVDSGVYVPETDIQFQLWLGASRDMEELRPDWPTFQLDELSGRIIRRGNRMGVMHGLVGRLADVAIKRLDLGAVQGGSNFNPHDLDYSQDMRFHASLQEGVGHLLFDAADSLATSAQTGLGNAEAGLGIIYSHPLISLKHDLGRSDNQASMVVHDQRLFVANGGRPSFIDERLGARFVGMIPPATAPIADIVRKPILRKNTPRTGDADFVAGTFVTPLVKAADGSDQAAQRFHFDNPGTWYLRQTYHKEMAWEFPDGGTRDLFAFKCYFMLRNTHGRVPIYSQRGGVDSGGPFIEVRDGHIYFGWFDLEIKKEVWIKTNVPVVRAGYWGYLLVRKVWPNQNSTQGNWENSINEEANTSPRDAIIYRELDQDPPAAIKQPWWSHHDNGRMSVSFTTEDYRGALYPNIPATGLVSKTGITYSGDASGQITASGAVFLEDHIGMVFWFDPDDVPSSLEKPYIITNVVSSMVVDVLELDGSTPDLTAASADGGGVFSGVTLVKSDDYDTASRPDPGPYDIELFGSSLAADPASGISPYDGKFDSFAYVVTPLSGADVFESSAGAFYPHESGADDLNDVMGGTSAPGPLRVDAGGWCFAAVHTNTYTAGGAEQDVTAKVFPNKELEVALSDESSVNALPPRVEYIRQPTLFRARRLVRIAFHDPTLGVTSFPGPPLTVVPEAEDINNPAGDVRLVLRNLPISPDGEHVQRYVYLTQPGGFSFFLHKIVPDNESTSVELRLSDNPLEEGEVLRFDNLDPPDCRLLASSQGHLFFGALTGTREQPNGIAYSQYARPFSVPPTNLVVINAGGADAIRGMSGHRGKLVVYKGDYVARVLVRGAVALVEEITKSVGCAAHQTVEPLDNRLYSLAPRGHYAYTGSGTPAWIAHNLEGFFTGEGAPTVDESELERASGAINMRRNQYVIALQAAGEHHRQLRVTTEYDHELSGIVTGRKLPALHRFGRLRHPNITALGVQNPIGGAAERLVGGTEEGFVVWLDRSDTRRFLVGEDASIWGTINPAVPSVVVGDPFIGISGAAIDRSLESIRGCPIYWGQDNYETALFATNSHIHLDRKVEATESASPIVRIGPRVAYWETRWMTLGRIESDKSFRFMDFVHAVAAGKVVVQAFVDMDESVDRLGAYEHNLDADQGQYGYATIDINNLKGRRVKFRFYIDYKTPDFDLELLELALRGQDADVK